MFGRRNLYSIYDAYLFAYLDLLRQYGISTDALQRILLMFIIRFRGEELPVKTRFSRQERWFAIGLTKLVAMTYPVRERVGAGDGVNLEVAPLAVNDVYDKIGIQIAVNIAKLREEVDARAVRVLKHKNKARRKTAPSQ